MAGIIWWGMFVVSLSLLILLVLQNRHAGAWLGKMGLRFVVAALVLFGLNLVLEQLDVRIPINFATIGAVGLLGLPGLALLVAVKLVFI